MFRRHLIAIAMLPLAGLLAGCGGEETCADRGLEEIEWYLDRDRDTFGDRTVVVLACEDRNPGDEPDAVDDYVTNATDCDDLRPAVYPQAVELCDGLDNNCNGAVDDGLPFNDFWIDNDADGFGDPGLQIEACNVPENGADRPGDCDDTNPAVNPDAIEICNEIDDDCDALVDDDDDAPLAEGGVDVRTGLPWRPDVDLDGFGNWNLDTEVYACVAPEGYVADATDCNDEDETINPDAQEVCSGDDPVDENCNQLYDDSDPAIDVSTQSIWYRDADADGHGVPDESIQTCTTPWFFSLTDDDCDDTDPLILAPTNTIWAFDDDRDGFGDPATAVQEPACIAPGTGYVSLAAGEDCDDTNADVFPGQIEICNEGVDDDCDELADNDDLWFEEGGVDVDSMTPWFVDADADGYGDPTQGYLACSPVGPEVADFTDCDDTRAYINPGMPEICNQIDDNCDFREDDEDPNLDVDTAFLYTRDADGDGWGDLSDVVRSCNPLEGYTVDFGDCDDSDPAIGLPTHWWYDEDGDGQGDGAIVTPATCESPAVDHVPWYVDSEPDCDPLDPFAFSGPEICYDGIDQGCDGRDYVQIADGDCDLPLPDTCVQAQNFEPIRPDGQAFTGTLEGNVNNLDTTDNASCTGGTQSSAGEAFMPILVPAGTGFKARLRIEGGDSVLYLVDSCFTINSCIIGSNASTLPGGF